MLWESSDCDLEIIAVVTANVLDKINAMDETALNCLPFVLASWGITSEC